MPFPVDSKFIEAAEQKLGLTFPSMFRGHILKSNGGDIETDLDAWQLFPFLDSSDRKRLARTCNDIVRETILARDLPGFPSGAVAIGSNGGGDVCLSLFQNPIRHNN